MICHYTDCESAAEIVAAGVIRAHPLTLYSDLFMRGPSIETAPAVWLTTSDAPDGTVLAKLHAGGWPAGSVRRIVVEVPDAIGLMDFAAHCDLDPSWFGCMLLTAGMAGSDPEQWRLVTRDIRAAEIVAVEKCD